MIGIKKIRTLTSVLSLVVMVVLAIIVVRLTRLPETDIPPIRWEPPKQQLIQKPTKVVKQPKRKLVIPELRKKPSSPVPVNTKAEQVPQPFEEEPGEESDLLRENIPDMLAWAIEVDFPELNLLDSEFRELTETVMTFRESMQGLRKTERTRENAESILQMRDQMDKATTDIKRITGMNLMEFLLRAPPKGGIDYDEPDNEESDFEYMDNSGQ